MTQPSSLSVMTAHGRSDRIGLWVALALGALLMLAAALAGGEENGVTVKRTDHFNGTLSPGASLRVENISGDIVAVGGKEFSATVSISVTAPTKERAEELLKATTVQQKRKDQDLTLRSIWPDSETGSWKKSKDKDKDKNKDKDKDSDRYRYRRSSEGRCEDCKITARYQVTLPPGVHAVFHTVNGEVRSEGPDADLELSSVNGPVLVRGGRRAVSAESVNGKIDIGMQALASLAMLHAKTVNGSVVVTLPKDARFELSASTMNGTIASTFPLPVKAAVDKLEKPGTPEPPETPETPQPPRKVERPEARRPPRRVVVRDEGDDVVVDVEELQREIEQSVRQVEVELRDAERDYGREMRRMKVLQLHRDYSGSIGQNGGKLRLSTLNGSITVLADGTKESEAKTLLPDRRGFAITIPEVRVHTGTVVRTVPRAVVLPGVLGEDHAVTRGDVSGDFLATSGGGNYQIGKVTGNVKIVTHGEIHVASAGAGADLTTYGGDIHIGPVTGDLKAKTLAGEIRAGAITGAITLETSGGDIRVEGSGGPANVRTGGGDIILRGARGGVEADSGGGDVRLTILGRDARGGISVRDAGGDVTLTVPPDFKADVDLEVQDSDDQEMFIRSDFPEIAVTRNRGSQRGAGAINGGGPKVVVRTHSGTIRLRKSSS
jgi:DUF4097 and DUF4098 domain-containing protein YvlB